MLPSHAAITCSHHVLELGCIHSSHAYAYCTCLMWCPFGDGSGLCTTVWGSAEERSVVIGVCGECRRVHGSRARVHGGYPKLPGVLTHVSPLPFCHLSFERFNGPNGHRCEDRSSHRTGFSGRFLWSQGCHTGPLHPPTPHGTQEYTRMHQ